MEFWQIAVTCAAVLYVVEEAAKIIVTKQQNQIETKIIALQEQIKAVDEEIWPMFELWWTTGNGNELAIATLEREFKDDPEPRRSILVAQAASELGTRIGHYALDLKTQALHKELERLLVKSARTPRARYEATCAITERKEHMREHEDELVHYGYKPSDLAQRFGPSH